MDTKECTWCEFTKSVYSRDLEAELVQLIASFPQDTKVSPEVHAKRLAICTACEDCDAGACRHCGCYVAARTVREGMSCPKPGNAKW